MSTDWSRFCSYLFLFSLTINHEYAWIKAGTVCPVTNYRNRKVAGLELVTCLFGFLYFKNLKVLGAVGLPHVE